MTGNEAKDYGLVDEVLTPAEINLAAIGSNGSARD
jgi:ATP-dependent protease ClpP protease subunit